MAEVHLLVTLPYALRTSSESLSRIYRRNATEFTVVTQR